MLVSTNNPPTANAGTVNTRTVTLAGSATDDVTIEVTQADPQLSCYKDSANKFVKSARKYYAAKHVSISLQ